jgi:hypothetical protein
MDPRTEGPDFRIGARDFRPGILSCAAAAAAFGFPVVSVRSPFPVDRSCDQLVTCRASLQIRIRVAGREQSPDL